MIDTNISLDMKDPKKSLDEICLARCCEMAINSLNPAEFDKFINIYNILIKRRSLQNKPIKA